MGKIYQQLSIEERTMIQTQLEMGIKPAAIAVGLNRSASTLSRELRRNGWTRSRTAGFARRRAAARDVLRWRAVTAPKPPIGAPRPAWSPRGLSAACDQGPNCGIRSCDT